MNQKSTTNYLPGSSNNLKLLLDANPSTGNALECEIPPPVGTHNETGDECSLCSDDQPLKWSSNPFALAIAASVYSDEDYPDVARVLIESGFDDFVIPYTVACLEENCQLPEHDLSVHMFDALVGLQLPDAAIMLGNKVGIPEDFEGEGDGIITYMGPFKAIY